MTLEADKVTPLAHQMSCAGPALFVVVRTNMYAALSAPIAAALGLA